MKQYLGEMVKEERGGERGERGREREKRERTRKGIR